MPVDQDDPRERAAEAEPDPVEDENEDEERDWVAGWLPPEGTVCWQAALLSAAHTAAYGQWTTVQFC